MNLEERLTWLLKTAEVEHKVEVLNSRATDEDWPEWYAHFLAQHLESESIPVAHVQASTSQLELASEQVCEYC